MASRLSILLLLAAPALAEDILETKFREFYEYDLRQAWIDRKDSELRTILLKKLQPHDTAGAARWLLQEVILANEPADEVREAHRILSMYKGSPAAGAMAEVLAKSKRGTDARGLILLALGRMRVPEAEAPLEAALKDADVRTLVAACDAVGASLKTELAPKVVPLLAHRSPIVRTAAVRCVAALRAVEPMPALLKCFCGETDPRVRYEAWKALAELTKEKLPCDPPAWKEWFAKESAANPELWGTSFPPVKGPAAAPAYFFRIPIHSDRICFVLDASGRMEDAWAIDFEAERKKEGPDRTPGFFNVKTRWQLVLAHLGECLKRLPDSTEVAIVCYSHEVKTFPEDRLRYWKNSPKNREKLLDQASKVERSGANAMYEGLAAGWGFLKGGSLEANYEAGCDTLVFVTNGQPSAGEMKNKPERIQHEAWRVALLRKMTIHTVGIHNHAYDLLKGMAKDTGGLYVHVQQLGDAAEPQDLDFWPEKKKAFEEARKARKAG